MLEIRMLTSKYGSAPLIFTSALLLATSATLLACSSSSDSTPEPDAGPGTEDGGVTGDAAPGDTPDAGEEPEPPPLEVGDGVQRETATVGGIAVDKYTWTDSAGRTRTASLKRQGRGNSGNGGYAVEFTYEVPDGEGTRTVTVSGTGGGEQGFGYFVAHELYRNFDDATSGTIASVHGEDDSPLGFGFPVRGAPATIAEDATSASHTFTSTYPKWGTVAPMADVTGATPKARDAHKKFVLPLSIRWTFEKGADYPRVDVKLDLGEATAGQLAFDVRGPYGVVEFADGNAGATINNVLWGDSAFHFSTRVAANADLTTGADWVWNEAIGASRPYQAMLARHPSGVLYELGLVELKIGDDTGLVYGNYSNNRGTTRAASGNALLSDNFGPGDWPFQSAQYSGVSAAAPTTGKKFAWGSSALYGSQFTTQFLGAGLSVPIVAYPPSKALVYRTCMVLGVSSFTDAAPRGLTRDLAASATPSCATAQPLE